MKSRVMIGLGAAPKSIAILALPGGACAESVGGQPTSAKDTTA